MIFTAGKHTEIKRYRDGKKYSSQGFGSKQLAWSLAINHLKGPRTSELQEFCYVIECLHFQNCQFCNQAYKPFIYVFLEKIWVKSAARPAQKLKCMIQITYVYKLISKLEISLEQREVAFLSPSKIFANLNFSREIQISHILLGDKNTTSLCSKNILEPSAK